MTSLEARAAATSKIDAIHAELSSFLLLVLEEVKRRLGSQVGIERQLRNVLKQVP